MKAYIAIAVIIVLTLFLLILERKGKIERKFIFFIYRTQRLKNFIETVSKFKFWKIFSTIGVVIGIIAVFLMIINIALLFYFATVKKEPIEGGVQLVIPGVTIPFWYGIIALITVILAHELMHGIIARNEKIRLKNLGAIFFASIPIGAFVEPNEDDLKNSSSLSKLRVYAAGSFANIILALVAMVLMVPLNDGVEIIDIMEGSPAEGILESGMVIKKINGKEIKSLSDFMIEASKIKPNQVVVLETDKGVFKVIAKKREDNPERGMIGIYVKQHVVGGLDFIYFTLLWISFLNLGIGLINLAPINFGVAATDGHLILKELLSKVIKEKAEEVSGLLSTTVTIMLLFALILSR